jgi:hypothetical protein
MLQDVQRLERVVTHVHPLKMNKGRQRRHIADFSARQPHGAKHDTAAVRAATQVFQRLLDVCKAKVAVRTHSVQASRRAGLVLLCTGPALC